MTRSKKKRKTGRTIIHVRTRSTSGVFALSLAWRNGKTINGDDSCFARPRSAGEPFAHDYFSSNCDVDNEHRIEWLLVEENGPLHRVLTKGEHEENEGDSSFCWTCSSLVHHSIIRCLKLLGIHVTIVPGIGWQLTFSTHCVFQQPSVQLFILLVFFINFRELFANPSVHYHQELVGYELLFMGNDLRLGSMTCKVKTRSEWVSIPSWSSLICCLRA